MRAMEREDNIESTIIIGNFTIILVLAPKEGRKEYEESSEGMGRKEAQTTILFSTRASKSSLRVSYQKRNWCFVRHSSQTSFLPDS